MKFEKKRLLSLLLAVSIMLSMVLPVAALEKPQLPSGGVTVFADDVRIKANQDATVHLEIDYDTTVYTHANGGKARITIPTGVTGVSSTKRITGSGTGALFTQQSSLSTSGTGNLTFNSGDGAHLTYDMKIPAVTATFQFKMEGVTGQNYTGYLVAGGSSQKVPVDSIVYSSGSVIVQYPVTVVVQGLPVAGAAVSVKTKDYPVGAEKHATYDAQSSDPSLDLSTDNAGVQFWVDSGANQQNSPILNVSTPASYVARYIISDTEPAEGDWDTAKTAGSDMLLGAISKETKVWVKFIQTSTPSKTEYTIQYNPNGGRGSIKTDVVAEGGSHTIEQSNLYNRPGYVFSRWTNKEQSDPATEEIYKVGEVYKDIKTNHIIWAQWFQKNGDNITVPGTDGKFAPDGTNDDNVTVKPGPGVTEEGKKPTVNNGNSGNGNVKVPEGSTGIVERKNPDGAVEEIIVPGGTEVTPDGKIILPEPQPKGSTINPEHKIPENLPADYIAVTYEPNGAEGTAQKQIVKKDAAHTAIANPFTYDNKVFDNWNTVADGSGTAYAAGKGTIPTTASLTVYAQWLNGNKDDGSITVPGKNGKLGDHDDVTIRPNGENKPSWDDKKQGENEPVVDVPSGAVVETPQGNVIPPDGSYVRKDGTIVTPPNNKELKPGEALEGHIKVTYQPNGANGKNIIQYVQENATGVTTIKNPFNPFTGKENWQFLMWTDKATSTNYKENAPLTIGIKDVTLDAVWYRDNGDNTISVPGKDGELEKQPNDDVTITPTKDGEKPTPNPDKGGIEVPTGGGKVEYPEKTPATEVEVPGGTIVKPDGSLILPDTKDPVDPTDPGVELPDGYIRVTYKANEGTGADVVQIAKKAGLTAKKNSFTAPTGWTFWTWNTKEDGNGTTYNVAASLAAETGNDLTLYAIWYKQTGDEITVPGKDAKPEGKPDDNVVVKPGPDVTEEAKKPTVDPDKGVVKVPYDSAGTVVVPDGSEVIVPGGTEIKPDGTIRLPGEKNPTDPEKPTIPDTFVTVTYLPGKDGNGSKVTQIVTKGATATILDNTFTAPARFTFDAWYTQEGGYGTKYEPKQPTEALNENLELIANWTEKNAAFKGTVIMEPNDGGASGNSAVRQEIGGNSGTEFTAKLRRNTFTVSGWTFGLWSDQQNGVAPTNGTVKHYKDEAFFTVKKDTEATLYAQWYKQDAATGSITVPGKDGNPRTDENNVTANGSTTEQPKYNEVDGTVTIPNGGTVTAPNKPTINLPNGGILYPDGTVKINDGKGGTVGPVDPTNPDDIPAGWRVVEYVGNGAKEANVRYFVKQDTEHTVLANMFSREGHVFSRWTDKQIDAAATPATMYKTGDQLNVGTEQKYELFAQWFKLDNDNIIVPGKDGELDKEQDNVTVKPNPDKPNVKPSVDENGNVKVPEGGQVENPDKSTIIPPHPSVVKPDGTIVGPDNNTIDPANPGDKYVTITYEAGEGSGKAIKQIVAKGGNTTALKNSFTAPSGKKFEYWKNEAVADETYNGGDAITNVAADLTLTAQWKLAGELKYKATVKFHSNLTPDTTQEQTIGSVDQMTFTGKLMTPKFAAPEGWKLFGWSTKQNGGYPAEGEKREWYKDGQEVRLSNNNVLEIYAIWQKTDAGSNVVKFPGKDGTPATDSTPVTGNDDITITPPTGGSITLDGEKEGVAKVPQGGTIAQPNDRTYTVKEAPREDSVKVYPDGTIVVGPGATVTDKDGKDITGPAIIDPDGNVTPDGGDKPFVKPDGTIVVPGKDGKTGTKDDVIILPNPKPEKAGTIGADGNVTIDKDATTVKIPGKTPGDADSAREVTVPTGTVVKPDGTITLPDDKDGAMKDPDGGTDKEIPGGSQIDPTGKITWCYKVVLKHANGQPLQAPDYYQTKVMVEDGVNKSVQAAQLTRYNVTSTDPVEVTGGIPANANGKTLAEKFTITFAYAEAGTGLEYKATITFKSNIDNAADEKQELISSTNATLKGTLRQDVFTAPADWTFMGWSTAQNGASTGTFYKNGAAVTMSDKDTLTLYAIWHKADNDVKITVPGKDGKTEGQPDDNVVITPGAGENLVVKKDDGEGYVETPTGSTVKQPAGEVEVVKGPVYVYPDGSIRVPDGSQVKLPDGSVIDGPATIDPDGKPNKGSTWPIQKPDGSIVIPGEDGRTDTPDDVIVKPVDGTTNPSGTIDPGNGDVTITNPDATVEIPGKNPGQDGSKIDVKVPDGTVINPNGTITLPDDKAGKIEPDKEIPGGSQIAPDGTVTWKYIIRYVDKNGNALRTSSSILVKDGQQQKISAIAIRDYMITGDSEVTVTGGTEANAAGTTVSEKFTVTFTYDKPDTGVDYEANIVFKANQDGVADATQKLTSRASFNLTGNLNANPFTAPTGWTFMGWSTEQNGKEAGTFYADQASVTLTHGTTLTLYAIWYKQDGDMITVPGKDGLPGQETDNVVITPGAGGNLVVKNNDGEGYVETPTGGTVNQPNGKVEVVTGPVYVYPDGSIRVPEGSSVKLPDGSTINGPATIDPDGTTDASSNKPFQKPDGTIVVPGKDSKTGTDDDVIIRPNPSVPNAAGTIDPITGNVTIDKDNTTVEIPGQNPGQPDSKKNVTVPGGTVVQPDGTIILPDDKDGKIEPDKEIPGGSRIDPDGIVTYKYIIRYVDEQGTELRVGTSIMVREAMNATVNAVAIPSYMITGTGSEQLTGGTHSNASGVTLREKYTVTFVYKTADTPTPPAGFTLAVTPHSAIVNAGKSQSFTALKDGAPTQNVTWTVTGGNGSSSIDANGVLTVGSSEADYTILTITATSTEDGTVTAVAYVTVRVENVNPPAPNPNPTPITPSAPSVPSQREDKPSNNGVADPSMTGVAGWLNTVDHIVYMNGIGGGQFAPNANMTRAQVAQMFYNLLWTKESGTPVTFSDVPAGKWYTTAVNVLASHGIITGSNGKFRPNDPITRAEFVAIAMRFARQASGATASFTDVSRSAWYYSAVASAVSYGWIGGYSDGTFRPTKSITRAEVVTIVNRMLGRAFDTTVDSGRLTRFVDVAGSHWAFSNIAEATTAHDYTNVNGVETWTK